MKQPTRCRERRSRIGGSSPFAHWGHRADVARLIPIAAILAVLLAVVGCGSEPTTKGPVVRHVLLAEGVLSGRAVASLDLEADQMLISDAQAPGADVAVNRTNARIQPIAPAAIFSASDEATLTTAPDEAVLQDMKAVEQASLADGGAVLVRTAGAQWFIVSMLEFDPEMGFARIEVRPLPASATK